MIRQSIPLSAISNALMLAQIRTKASNADGGEPIARFAAFEQHPALNTSCADARRGHTPHPRFRQHFGPMFTGALDRVADRMRLYHGLPEVRRTWGAGIKAIKAACGVMR